MILLLGVNKLLGQIPRNHFQPWLHRDVATTKQGQFLIRIFSPWDDNINLPQSRKLAKIEQLNQNNVPIKTVPPTTNMEDNNNLNTFNR